MRTAIFCLVIGVFSLQAGGIGREDFPEELQDILSDRGEELKADGSVFIAGKVTMSDGSLIGSGKDVKINLSYGFSKPFRVYEGGWFMLDKNFAARYPGRDGKIYFRAFGYEPNDIPIKIQGGEIIYLELEMQKTAEKNLSTIKGVVVNDHNTPFEGARVALSFPSSSYGISNSPYKFLITGKDGRYSFEGLSSAEYSLTASAADYAYHNIWFTPSHGESLEEDLKLYPNKTVVLDYVFQANGDKNFTGDDLVEGTIEWTVGYGGLDFSDKRVENEYDPNSLRDIEIRQDQNSLVFKNFYVTGRNGFYDAGEVDFESIDEAIEAGYQTKEKPCVAGHSYIVRTYENKYVKFMVKRIFCRKKADGAGDGLLNAGGK